MKVLIPILFLIITCLSCKEDNEEINKIQIVENYIRALNKADYKTITPLFKDSIRLIEIDYYSAFSKEEYYPLFKWDSTFRPTYRILEIKEENEGVRMKVSKECQRILFLNEEPIITSEFVRFKDGSINSITIENYVIFNNNKWSNNRAKLVAWIEENHPELNGFLTDQTQQGALNYLKAIKLFQTAKRA